MIDGETSLEWGAAVPYAPDAPDRPDELKPEISSEIAVPPLIRQRTAATSRHLTLAAVIDGDTSLEWGDAVAVVQQLIEQVLAADPGAAAADIPSIESIGLDASGALHAQLERGGTRPLTAALGDLLHQLSSSIDRPPALRLFGMRAISAAPPLSLEAFTVEVADWAPPDCRNRLIKMHQRARARERSPMYAQRPSGSTFSRLQLLAASVLVVVGVAAVFGAFKFARGFGARPAQEPPRQTAQAGVTIPELPKSPVRAPEPPKSPVQAAPRETPGAQDIKLLPETSVDSLPTDRARAGGARPDPARANVSRPDVPRTDPSPARAKPTAPAPAAPRPSTAKAPASSPLAVKPAPAPVPPSVREVPNVSSPAGKAAVEEFQRARALFDGHSYAAAAAAFQHVIEMIGLEEAGGSDLRFVAGEYLALSRASLASLQSHVYTQGDAGVSEPVALGQFLPSAPDPSLPQSRLAVLELIIDVRGFVETARLQGEGSQYRTGWWVSAAKAWRFQPAMKDGNPVRFLKRVVVADSKPLEPR